MYMYPFYIIYVIFQFHGVSGIDRSPVGPVNESELLSLHGIRSALMVSSMLELSCASPAESTTRRKVGVAASGEEFLW